MVWVIVTGMVSGYFAFLLTFGDKGVMKLLEVDRTHRQLKKEIEHLEEQNKKMRQKVQALKTDPDTIESIAREELGLAKKGELIYQFKRESDDESNGPKK